MDLLVFVSDFHFGRATSGWNARRAEKTLQVIANQVAKIASEQPCNIHLLFLGDIMDGECVYPNQAYELELVGFEQVLEGAQIFFENLIKPLAKVSILHLDGVNGNHAYIRFASKKTNLDAFFYTTLEQLVREHKLNIKTTFWQRKENDTLEVKIVDCNSVKVLIGHGHFLFSTAEIPFASAQRRVLNWLATYRQKFDIAAFGHYHRFAFYTIAGDRFVLFNGCMLAHDEYALTRFGHTGNRLWAAVLFSPEGFVSLHLLRDEKLTKTDRRTKMESLRR